MSPAGREIEGRRPDIHTFKTNDLPEFRQPLKPHCNKSEQVPIYPFIEIV